MEEKAKAMVLASFAGDSLALGAHWIYDTELLAGKFGRVEDLLAPEPGSFHASKKKGDFTHYGDQTLVLLESLAAKREFKLEDFSNRWRILFSHYGGYVDKATKITLAGYAEGKSAAQAGSASEDLAGASRIAPLVYRYRKDLAKLIDAARAQTRMTHSFFQVVDAAEFFATVAWLVLDGGPPVRTMERVTSQQFANSPVATWVRDGLDSIEKDSVRAVYRFGQSCHVEEAFPGVVHLIAKYENDLREALIQSVMAGGDSAARAMLVGLVSRRASRRRGRSGGLGRADDGQGPDPGAAAERRVGRAARPARPPGRSVSAPNLGPGQGGEKNERHCRVFDFSAGQGGKPQPLRGPRRRSHPGQRAALPDRPHGHRGRRGV